MSILGCSISHLFEKIASEEKQTWIGKFWFREKKVDTKQKIIFPEVSAFIEVYRLLWEQMMLGETS